MYKTTYGIKPHFTKFECDDVFCKYAILIDTAHKQHFISHTYEAISAEDKLGLTQAEASIWNGVIHPNIDQTFSLQHQ